LLLAALLMPTATLLMPTATTLLYCLLYSSRKLRRPVPVWPVAASWEEKMIVVARRSIGARFEDRSSLPLHGRFVDRTLIRIHR
jgi:hypothetical protein